MRHAVVGAGGVGGLVGGALARAGHEVILLVRPGAQHPPQLRVHSAVLGDFEAPVTVASGPLHGVDVVWVTVKATQLQAALVQLPGSQVGDALVIPLLNGIDHMAVLRRHYSNVVAGAIVVETERTAPGVIAQLSPFAAIQLARDGADVERIERVAAEVRATGLDCTLVDDETALLWGKLMMLAPLALTTTARGGPLGTVRDDPEWRRLLDAAITEACTGAESNGVAADPSRIRAALEAAPAGMRSSMLKDVEAGNPPELEAIGGPVVRAGHAHGLDVSATEELMARVGARMQQRSASA